MSDNIFIKIPNQLKDLVINSLDINVYRKDSNAVIITYCLTNECRIIFLSSSEAVDFIEWLDKILDTKNEMRNKHER